MTEPGSYFLILLIVIPLLPFSHVAGEVQSTNLSRLSLQREEQSSEYLIFSGIQFSSKEALSFWIDFKSNSTVRIQLELDIVVQGQLNIPIAREVILDQMYTDRYITTRYSGSYFNGKDISMSLYLVLYEAVVGTMEGNAMVQWTRYSEDMSDNQIEGGIFPRLNLLEYKDFFSLDYLASWNFMLPIDDLPSTLVNAKVEMEFNLANENSKVDISLNGNKDTLIVAESGTEVHLHSDLTSVRLEGKNILSVASASNGTAKVVGITFEFKEDSSILNLIPSYSYTELGYMILIVSWGIYLVRYRRRSK